MKAKDDGDSATTAASDKKAAATEAFEELLKQYDTKIDALRKARDALKTAPPASPPADGGSDDAAGGVRWSRALLTIELFCEMIDDIMMDVVFETHFEAKQCASVCAVCNTRCQSDAALAEAAAADGPSSQPAAPDLFECPCCQRPYPAARFASHMDKCMGLSSRRAATRSAVSTPSYPPASYESSSEHSTDRKRKPPLSAPKDAAAASAGAGASGRKKPKRK